MQNSLVKVPNVLQGDWPWPSRSNLTWKSKFTPFWAYPCHNSPPIQAGTTKFGQKMQTGLVVIPIVLEVMTLTFKVKFNLLILKPTAYNTRPVLHSRSSPNLQPDLFTSEDQFFLWFTGVLLCVYNPDCIQDLLVCATCYLVTSWDFKTLKFHWKLHG